MNPVDVINFIVTKYNLNSNGPLPIEIPNIGRDDLPELFIELGYTEGAEIGVQQGEYSEVLASAGLKIHAVDPWRTFRGYREHVTQAKLDGFYAEARARLAPYDVTIHKKTSEAAALGFWDNVLDFVYIDGNHSFLHVTQDIAFWSRVVKPGGIIAGHDYIRRSQPTGTHVVEVVNAYTRAMGIKPWFVLGRRQKIDGEIRDKSRSWMWVNG